MWKSDIFRYLAAGYCVLLSVLLCTSANGSAQRAAKTDTPITPDSGDITLFQSTNRVLVLMQIGDGELVPMVFDTGAGSNSVDRMLVKRGGFKQIGKVLEIDGTTGKRRMLSRVATPKVALGGLKIGQIEAAVLDYNRQDAMGIISANIFTNSLVFLDLTNNRAVLTARADTLTPVEPAEHYIGDVPGIDIIMPDGTKLPAILDTGYNGALSLPIALMAKVPLLKPAQVVGRFKSINTEGAVYGGRINGTIRIGPIVLENPDVVFLSDHANVGLPIIRRTTLVIDPANKRDWVLPQGTLPVRVK